MENARWLWKCTGVVENKFLGNGVCCEHRPEGFTDGNVDDTPEYGGSVGIATTRGSDRDSKLPSQGVPGCKNHAAHPSRTNRRACSLATSDMA